MTSLPKLLAAGLLVVSSISWGQNPRRALPSSMLAEQKTAEARTDLSSLGKSIDSTMREWHVPGAAMSIVRDGSIVYMRGFGVRDVSTRQPVTPDTLFQIGSCTKAFTAAAIAMLVDEGKMRWDDKVNVYLPFFHLKDPLADENATIRDLLTHRTGLPGAELMMYHSPWTREELIRHITYLTPETGFRTHFEYQNLMYLVAGEAAAHAASTTWDELIRDRIFKPLGMANSTTHTADGEHSSNHATAYEQNPDGSVKAIAWNNVDNVAPAGSIVSSARDMAKWITLQLDAGTYEGKRLISEKNVEEMHEPQIVVPRKGEFGSLFFPDSTQLSYGFAWFVQDYHGHQLIIHPGGIDGFAAMAVLIPELHTGYFVVLNSNNLGAPERSLCRQVLTYQIADKLLDLPDVGWSARFRKIAADLKVEEEASKKWQLQRAPGTHPSRELSAYVGRFENPAYGSAEISLDDGKLVFQYHSASTLEYFQYDTFIVELPILGKTRVTFSLNQDGDVEKFTMLGICFQRKRPAQPGNNQAM